MSDNDSNNFVESSGERTTTGIMTGTITYLHNTQVIPFNAHLVYRRFSEGKTQIRAIMPMPGGDGLAYEVLFKLEGSEPPSATYIVGTPNVTDVEVFIYDDPDYQIAAESGEIILQNFTPTKKLTGLVKLKTILQGNKQYEVDAEFTIEGIENIT
ncbi:hypothetical protein HFK74_07935|uniref:hypothetical protein n=1 Tax=Pseudomonas sp. SbOxS1 TaxID=2723884 RepID=UPI0015D21413|nr:hypothetical protein [Pseudomonas sp. SbOxS1]NYU02626.1 hypothetical protein [Pseudomonas sp. SbOxS1]